MIKRWDMERGLYGNEYTPKKAPFGRWVWYEDHQRVVLDGVKQLDVLSNQVYELKKQLAEVQQKAVNAVARNWGREKY